MTIQNPPKLWAFRIGVNFEAEDSAEAAQGSWERAQHRYPSMTPQTYLRADLAAAQKAALVAERDALTSRVEKLREALSEVRHLLIGDCEYERQILDQNERDVIALAEHAIEADEEASAPAGKEDRPRETHPVASRPPG